jgi:hypothetical protein
MYRTHLAMHIVAGQRVRYITLGCCKEAKGGAPGGGRLARVGFFRHAACGGEGERSLGDTPLGTDL